MLNVILLPGLDGSGTLFSPFLEKVPEWANPIVIPYALDKVQDYDELTNFIFKSINQEQPYILVGESFSGPVALLVAAKSPKNLVGVVLCASFVTNPRPLLSSLFFPKLFRFFLSKTPPTWIIRSYLTGPDSSPELVKATISTIKSVSPDVLAARLAMVMSVDVSRSLENCSAPLLYICANQDKLVPSKALAFIQDTKPDISVSRIDGPHFIAQTQPGKVWQEISRFVEKISPKNKAHFNLFS